MNQGFWKKLKKPFFVLAPMADVTDAAFRRIITKYGKPDVLWTEFVSADGLMSPGREVLLKDLEYTEAERPIVAQLFGSNELHMEEASALCAKLGFDGIDINMGCPDKSIEKQGAGAAMIKNPESAINIIRAAKRGAPNLPISVKTRIGYTKNELESWLPLLLAEDLSAITIHARTRKELSNVPARWEHVRRAVELRDISGKETLIIGNGDVLDVVDGVEKAKETGCDGVMIGRAIFGNPWLFNVDTVVEEGSKDLEEEGAQKFWLHRQINIPLESRLKVLIEHSFLFETLLGGIKNFAVMKKHFKAYVNGFDGARELRVKLMEEGNSAEKVKEILSSYIERIAK